MQKHFTTFPEVGKCPLLSMPAGAHVASVCFLNSTYLVSLQYHCLFLQSGTVATVSGSVMAAQSGIEVTGCTCNSATSAPVEHVFITAGMFI